MLYSLFVLNIYFFCISVCVSEIMMQASFLLAEVNKLLSIYLIYSNQTFKQPVVLHISVCEINMALRFTQKIGILFILKYLFK